MPDEKGQLTDSEKAAFKAWAESKWPAERHACPICGTDNWYLGDRIANVPATPPGDVFFGGPSYPCVTAMCINCGYMRFVNAFYTNIVAPPAPKVKEAGNAN